MVLDGTWLGSALVGAGDSVGICALGTGAAVSSSGSSILQFCNR
jgi:F0F1-type ATP synthase membrane subunit c/vacuolar-type H+-ATPase subunit K